MAAPWGVADALWVKVEPLLRRMRWILERTFAWLHHFRRLLVRPRLHRSL